MSTDPGQVDLVNKDGQQEQKQCEQSAALLESHLAACHAARPTAHLLQMVDSLLIEISLFLSPADAFCFSLVCSRLHQLLNQDYWHTRTGDGEANKSPANNIFVSLFGIIEAFCYSCSCPLLVSEVDLQNRGWPSLHARRNNLWPDAVPHQLLQRWFCPACRHLPDFQWVDSRSLAAYELGEQDLVHCACMHRDNTRWYPWLEVIKACEALRAAREWPVLPPLNFVNPSTVTHDRAHSQCSTDPAGFTLLRAATQVLQEADVPQPVPQALAISTSNAAQVWSVADVLDPAANACLEGATCREVGHDTFEGVSDDAGNSKLSITANQTTATADTSLEDFASASFLASCSAGGVQCLESAVSAECSTVAPNPHLYSGCAPANARLRVSSSTSPRSSPKQEKRAKHARGSSSQSSPPCNQRKRRHPPNDDSDACERSQNPQQQDLPRGAVALEPEVSDNAESRLCDSDCPVTCRSEKLDDGAPMASDKGVGCIVKADRLSAPTPDRKSSPSTPGHRSGSVSRSSSAPYGSATREIMREVKEEQLVEALGQAGYLLTGEAVHYEEIRMWIQGDWLGMRRKGIDCLEDLVAMLLARFGKRTMTPSSTKQLQRHTKSSALAESNAHFQADTCLHAPAEDCGAVGCSTGSHELNASRQESTLVDGVASDGGICVNPDIVDPDHDLGGPTDTGAPQVTLTSAPTLQNGETRLLSESAGAYTVGSGAESQPVATEDICITTGLKANSAEHMNVESIETRLLLGRHNENEGNSSLPA